MSAELEQQARDPNTRLTQLQYIAQNCPELRPLVAANPSTYPALLDWLASLGDPAVDSALERRLEQARQQMERSAASAQAAPLQPSTPAQPSAPSRKYPPRSASTRQDAGQAQDAAQVSAGAYDNAQPPAGTYDNAQPPAGAYDNAQAPAGAYDSGTQTAPVASGNFQPPQAEQPPAAQPFFAQGEPATQPLSQPASATPEMSAPSGGQWDAAAQTTAVAGPADAQPTINFSTQPAQTAPDQAPAQPHPFQPVGGAGTKPSEAATPQDKSSATKKKQKALAKAKGKDEGGSADAASSKKKRLTYWIIAIVVILALVGTGLTVGILTDSLPFFSDKQTAGNGGQGNSASKASSKGEKGVGDASSADANGNGIPDAQEQRKAGGSIDLRNSDRLVVPPPENAASEKPVPDGAVTNISNFSSADGNIQCAIGEGGVQCALNSPSPSLNIGNEGKPIRITMDQSVDIAVEKLDRKVANSAQIKLSQGAAVSRGEFACQAVAGNGIDCWHVPTAHGFIMKPDSISRY